MKEFKVIFFAILLVFCFVSYVFAMPIISTFDVDDEGWIAAGADVMHENTGGNPGGFLSLIDTGGDTFTAYPSSKFKGNLLQFLGGVLSYDVIVIEPTTPLISIGSGFGRIQLHGGGSNATFDYAPNPLIPSSQFWTTYYVPMTAEAWNTTPENWTKVLSDVTNMHIILEPNNRSTVGLDNFKIQPIPEPSSMLLISMGLLGAGMLRRKKK